MRLAVWIAKAVGYLLVVAILLDASPVLVLATAALAGISLVSAGVVAVFYLVSYIATVIA